MKILTVDDSISARLIIKRMLGAEEHTILEASDGSAALHVLKSKGPFDLVLLDWNMPVMTGIECLREIRKIDAYKDLKVIMCTTEADKADVLAAIKAGADGYILKPFTPDVLKTQVARICGAAVDAG